MLQVQVVMVVTGLRASLGVLATLAIMLLILEELTMWHILEHRLCIMK